MQRFTLTHMEPSKSWKQDTPSKQDTYSKYTFTTKTWSVLIDLPDKQTFALRHKLLNTRSRYSMSDKWRKFYLQQWQCHLWYQWFHLISCPNWLKQYVSGFWNGTHDIMNFVSSWSWIFFLDKNTSLSTLNDTCNSEFFFFCVCYSLWAWQPFQCCHIS